MVSTDDDTQLEGLIYKRLLTEHAGPTYHKACFRQKQHKTKQKTDFPSIWGGSGGRGGGRGDPVISQEIKAERDRNRDREMTDLFILNGGSVSPSERHCNLVSSQGEFDLPVEAGCGTFLRSPESTLV